MSDSEFNIAHLIHLYAVGGVECYYTALINHGEGAGTVRHHAVLTRGHLSPDLREAVQKGASSIRHLKYAMGLKIPRRPAGLRHMIHQRMLGKMRADVLLYWNNPKFIDAFKSGDALPNVYYEHGASWLKPLDQAKDMQRALARMDAVICNSFAARRVLELKWGIPSHIPIKVCLNAIRPESMPAHAIPKRFPSGRAIRLGVAARLIAIKGIPLALHALRELKHRNLDCELWVAGAGTDAQRLRQLSVQLGIDRNVRFLGLVRDMAGFYENIDCLLSPSIRESFGLVCAEAMSHGCPVIAAKVDGLAEVVETPHTGFCLTPTLNAANYTRFGGDTAAMPDLVYSPESDDLMPPRLLDPAMIADSVEYIFSDAGLFERMSAAAIIRARDKFDFRQFAQTLLGFLKYIRNR